MLLHQALVAFGGGSGGIPALAVVKQAHKRKQTQVVMRIMLRPPMPVLETPPGLVPHRPGYRLILT